MMSVPSISHSSLMGMVVVSWLTIILIGGFWVGKTVYDFQEESHLLRSEHYTSQKELVRQEVENGLALVEDIRQVALADLWREVRVRGEGTNRQVGLLINELRKVGHSGDVGKTIMKLLASGKSGEPQLYAYRGKTLFAIHPFPHQLDNEATLEQLQSSLDGVVSGERQIAVADGDGGERFNFILMIDTIAKSNLRIVTGAGLEAAEEEVREYAVRRMEKARFGRDGYLFGGTWEGVSVLGPAKGRDMWHLTDVNGVRIVQELVDVAKRGGGFVSYVMPPIDGQRHRKKISYALPVPDWRWYIGAGLYVDDVEAIIDANRVKLKSDIVHQISLILTILGLLSIAAFLLSRRLTRKIRDNIHSFTNVWNQASTKGDLVDLDNLNYQEFKDLAEVANRMVEDRQSAERLLAESGAQFEALVGNIPGIVYQSTFDDKWQMVFVSDSVEDITGYPRSEFMEGSRTFPSIIDPRDKAWVMASIEKDVLVGRSFSIEYRIIRRDSSVHWLLDKGQGRPGELGQPGTVDGVIIDITERRKAEEQHYIHIHFLETMERIDRDIRRANTLDEMLSDSLDTLRNGFGADRSWMIYPCDPEALTYQVMVERAEPDFIGIGNSKLELPMDEDLQGIFTAALNFSGPVAYSPESGKRVPLVAAKEHGVKSQLVVAIYPRIGKPWLMGLHQCSKAREWTSEEKMLLKEVSRRVADSLSNMLMYRELKESVEKFRTFTEETTLGIALIQDDRVKFANRAYCEVFEVSVDEMVGIRIEEALVYVHPEDRAKCLEQINKKQAGDPDNIPVYSWRAVTATGRIRWVEVRSRIITLDGHTADLISLQDITEIRQSQLELKALVELRTADLEKKANELELAYKRLSVLDGMRANFFTLVSEDLNTPLTAVLEYTSMLREELDRSAEKDDAEQAVQHMQTSLGVLEQKGLLFKKLMVRFSDLIAIADGSAQWDDVAFDPVDQVRHVAAELASVFEAKDGVSLEVEADANCPQLMMDIQRFRQLLEELLLNALAKTASGFVRVVVHRESGSVQVRVEDSGSGIPDGYLETIFEPFNRVGDQMDTSSAGSHLGLGLALCRTIVAHYSGTVGVTSYLGKGSTFTLDLPNIVTSADDESNESAETI